MPAPTIRELVANEIPRRIRLDKMTQAELAIFEAVQAVEAVGADVRLTEAINLLHAAQEKVADYVDEQVGEKETT